MHDAIAAHLDELRARACRLLRDPHDADDLVHDVVERALRSGATPDQPRAWLFAILNHLVVDRARRRRRAPSVSSIDEALIAAPAPDARERWRELDCDALRAAVDEMPADLRTTWRLRVDDALDYDAIAARLDIPRSTVGTRLARARARLRERLAYDRERTKRSTSARSAGVSISAQ